MTKQSQETSSTTTRKTQPKTNQQKQIIKGVKKGGGGWEGIPTATSERPIKEAGTLYEPSSRGQRPTR